MRLIRFQIASATFSILALELTLIRWMSQQVRVFAYLNNILLMAAFLGMGLGVALGKRHPRLAHATLPLLLLLCALLCYAKPLDLAGLSFPDRSVALWGADGIKADERFATNLELLLVLFGLVASVFVCAGAAVGDRFGKLDALDAYSADLLGSLLGVAAVTLLSVFPTSPPVWLVVSCIPFLWLSPRWTTYVALAGIAVFGWLAIAGAEFSPYYRIDLHPRGPGSWTLDVNRDAHQHMIDLSGRALRDPALTPADREARRDLRRMYDFPFQRGTARGSALIVGAGTGNDVAAALRNGFQHVVAVEIDPVILRIGRRMHPEHPYDDPRVTAINSDARTYFERDRGQRFDVVCFGLLDSHGMFTSMSTLRLDNYVYTIESFRSAWRHVAPGGVMSINFYVSRLQFIADRLITNLRAATGGTPVTFRTNTGSQVFMVARGAQACAGLPIAVASQAIAASTDDWPFLYVRPGSFPAGYIAVLAAIALLALVGTALVFGPAMFTAARFDGPMFFLGAAFLLIETRGVTDLSLLFGSTWIVNAAVFAGVLFIAFVVNAMVRRVSHLSLKIMFLPLAAALALSAAIRPVMLLQLPMFAGGALGAIVNALPVGLAGVIFSTLLARSSDPAASLGSNLIGAIAGGILEYLSTILGLSVLTLVAAGLYGAVFLLLMKRPSVARASSTRISIAAAK